MSQTVVLVVEDVPKVRAAAVSVLESFGCEVLDTYDGHEAMRMLHARPDIGVLLTDVRMPGMSGSELAEAARRLRPDLKVVLTSGYVGAKDLPEDLPFVPKPWRAQDLAAAVRS